MQVCDLLDFCPFEDQQFKETNVYEPKSYWLQKQLNSCY